jgi:cell division protein FtsX
VAVPAGVGAANYSERVGLIAGVIGGVAAAAILAILALVLARYAQERVQRTLGRSRGYRAAQIGRLLGVVGVCVAVTGGLALGFFGLLELFAR